MRPTTVEEASAMLAELGAAGKPVRPVGGGTKPWGPAGGGEPLQTSGLTRILEHNAGDFTAVLEAGAQFEDVQAELAAQQQMIAWDPPAVAPATVGGIMAAGDSGPLRHRYGGVRDLVLGTTVVLSDGTVARSGGRVIKNVAGYDLAKLFAGSFGTLGLIATLSVRLHPLAAENATARGRSDDPERLQAAAVALAQLPLEATCLDVCWEDGAGSVLVRHSGPTAAAQARVTAGRMQGLEQIETLDDDAAVWERQRSLQRSPGAVVKVSGRATDLAAVLRAAGDGTVVSRAALGLSWIALPDGDGLAERVAAARSALAPRACTVLDGADKVADPWPDPGPGLVVMERLKARFDPARIFRPGTFVGGI